MLQWFMDAAHGHPVRSSTQELTIRVLVLNFASIHTTANSFAHALYTLAAHPEYAQPLREEVKAVVGANGWTKAALSNMNFVDAFLKESMRVNTINGREYLPPDVPHRRFDVAAVSLTRIAMVPYTFSDGTRVPAGTFLGAPTTATHLDSELYLDPEIFDPKRHLRGEEDSSKKAPQQLVATSPTWIPFGHGKSACPGRMFAVSSAECVSRASADR